MLWWWKMTGYWGNGFSQVRWVTMALNLLCSSDGIDALQKLNQHHIDLIISEINMPKMDGIELLNTVKEYGKDTMVVYLTKDKDFPCKTRIAVRCI